MASYSSSDKEGSTSNSIDNHVSSKCKTKWKAMANQSLDILDDLHSTNEKLFENVVHLEEANELLRYENNNLLSRIDSQNSSCVSLKSLNKVLILKIKSLSSSIEDLKNQSHELFLHDSSIDALKKQNNAFISRIALFEIENNALNAKFNSLTCLHDDLLL